MVCGNITGNISDPINIILYTTESTVKPLTDRLYYTTENQGMHNSTTETMRMNNSPTSNLKVYIISFSCLATALFVGAVASLIAIVIFLKRSKAKIRAVSVQSKKTEGTTHYEPAYENVMLSPSLSVNAINTHDNVAYGNIKTSTRGAGATQQDVPMYEKVTDPIPLVSTIDTQDNVAYDCKQL